MGEIIHLTEIGSETHVLNPRPCFNCCGEHRLRSFAMKAGPRTVESEMAERPVGFWVLVVAFMEGATYLRVRTAAASENHGQWIWNWAAICGRGRIDFGWKTCLSPHMPRVSRLDSWRLPGASCGPTTEPYVSCQGIRIHRSPSLHHPSVPPLAVVDAPWTPRAAFVPRHRMSGVSVPARSHHKRLASGVWGML